jgi:hypothetical protein
MSFSLNFNKLDFAFLIALTGALILLFSGLTNNGSFSLLSLNINATYFSWVGIFLLLIGISGLAMGECLNVSNEPEIELEVAPEIEPVQTE